MVTVDECTLDIIRDFLAQNWSSFVEFHKDRGADGQAEAQRIYEAIGGEPE